MCVALSKGRWVRKSSPRPIRPDSSPSPRPSRLLRHHPSRHQLLRQHRPQRRLQLRRQHRLQHRLQRQHRHQHQHRHQLRHQQRLRQQLRLPLLLLLKLKLRKQPANSPHHRWCRLSRLFRRLHPSRLCLPPQRQKKIPMPILTLANLATWTTSVLELVPLPARLLRLLQFQLQLQLQLLLSAPLPPPRMSVP